MSNRLMRWIFWSAAGVMVAATAFSFYRYMQPRRPLHSANASAKKSDPDATSSEPDPEDPGTPEVASVKVVHPTRGTIERSTVQVGTVEAFNSVKVHAQVSGYLKKQAVDIGSRVKAGDVLAVVDVPVLEKLVEKNDALVELAKERVKQMNAKVEIAKADVEAAKAQVLFAEANALASNAWVTFRALQHQRVKDLFASRSIEEKVVDESKERLEAAKESSNASRAAVVTAKAQVGSANAKVHLAEADLGEAGAQVKVARAEFERTRVQLAYATIIAPFDGKISERTFVPGDFIHSAADGGSSQSLFTIERTDLMRVVVQVPDEDARHADPGDPVMFEITALKGVKFMTKIARVAGAEDRRTRMMRVELDLPNPKNQIHPGMYGKATILLDKVSDRLVIPRNCIVGKVVDGKATVFVHREGRAQRVPIKVGVDNGVRIEVLEDGLKATDEIVLDPPSSLFSGLEINATLIEQAKENIVAAP
ncbi:MAG TPA: efflux RND transporter periplasmic adaptor subunit [Gemmataceae bacterium]|nr:efflux RND transporter periplasmic adaptor subunit [Gemmataceae bacterium]